MKKRAPVLVNVETRNRTSLGKFQLPTKAERKNVVTGDLVKLVWEDINNQTGECGERMWVEVTDYLSAGKFKGELRNDPYYFKGSMKHGDIIIFGPQNICQIERG